MLTEVTALVEATGSALQELESRLIELIRGGAHGTISLDEVLADIAQVISGIRPHFERLREAKQRRDLPYESISQLEALRKHSLWLYRKCRAEDVFFAKLRLERTLRDCLHRKVVEAWHEMESLNELERKLQTMSEDALANELLGASALELDREMT